MSDEEYSAIMEQAYKAPDYLSPHDIDSRLDDDGYIMDYSEMVSDNIFIGDYPFNEILEAIDNQFSSYMTIEDKTNYVDIFYVQYKASVVAAEEDDNDFHLQEILEKLSSMKDQFIDKIFRLFEDRLTITITAVDDESTPDIDELELVIRQLYQSFILNAKENFLQAIGAHIANKVFVFSEENDESYFSKIKEILRTQYSPLIKCMTPTEFLKYSGNDEIDVMYNQGIVAGNFLRKYTPRLYQNEEFEVELINYITMVIDQAKHLIGNGNKEEEVNGESNQN